MTKKYTILFSLILLFTVTHAQKLIHEKVAFIPGNSVYKINAIIYLPKNYSKNKKYPLVIYSHGMGEAGTNVNYLYRNGLPKVLKEGYKPSFDFIMVAPQRSSYSVDPKWLEAVLDDCKNRWNIDDNRIYLTGISAGGWTAYGSQLNIDKNFGKQFAGIVIISGATQDAKKRNFSWWKNTKTPLWAIVGKYDVSYRDQNIYMVDQINKQVNGLASITIRSGIGHSGWNDVYKGKVKNGNKDIWDWMYARKRNGKLDDKDDDKNEDDDNDKQNIDKDKDKSPSTPSVPKQPVTNTPAKSIAKIEAEDYDRMDGVNLYTVYRDAGRGQYVGSISSGDWMEYVIDVPQTGNYTISYRIASPRKGSAFTLKVNNKSVQNVELEKCSGWEDWKTTEHTVNLKKGKQTLKIFARGSGWNINWFELKAKGNNVPDVEEKEETKKPVVEVELPKLPVIGGNTVIKVEAEDYVSKKGINVGSNPYIGDCEYVYNLDAGDWLDYEVKIPKSGTYKIKYRVLSKSGKNHFKLLKNGKTIDLVNIPNSDLWNQWKTVTQTVNLTAGEQTLRIAASNNNWIVDWFELTKS